MSEIYILHNTSGNVRGCEKDDNEEYSLTTNYPVNIYILKQGLEKYLKRDNYLSEIDTEAKRRAARTNLGIAESAALNWGNINGDILALEDLMNLFNNSFGYLSELPSSAYMLSAVGNIPQGTTVRELTGTNLSKLIDKLLFKESWPGVETTHSLTLTQLVTTVEVGTSIVEGYVYFLPSRNADWVRPIQTTYYVDDILFSTKSEEESESVPSGAITVYSSAKEYRHYARVQYPDATFSVVSNFGHETTYTIPAGLITTPTKVVTAKFPVFAYTTLDGNDNATGLTKQPLHSSNTYSFTLLAGSSELLILIPTTEKPTILEWNEDLQAFAASNTTWNYGEPETVIINNVIGQYMRYTYGDQYRGDTTIQISW